MCIAMPLKAKNTIPLSVRNLNMDDLVSLLKKIIDSKGYEEQEKQEKYGKLLDCSRKFSEYTALQMELLKKLGGLGYSKSLLNKIEKDYNIKNINNI